MQDWYGRYYRIAKEVEGWSKDWSTKVGCVAFDSLSLIPLSFGYNGFARGMDDELPERKERAIKNKLTVHAEANMVANATRSGVSLNNATVVVTFFPCAGCAGILRNSGVKTIVAVEPDWNHERWGADFAISKGIFDETGVKIVFIEEPNGN